MTNEPNEVLNKPSFCYGCGQVLRNYSLLVCSECLSDECDKFASLVQITLKSKQKKVKKVGSN